MSIGAFGAPGDQPDYLAKIKELGFPSLSGQLPTYYSAAYREHAATLQAAIEDMNTYYRARLGVQANLILAVLDSKDWTKVTGGPWGLPGYQGESTPLFFMPAASGSPVFLLMMARKDAIPPPTLEAFLKDNHAAADQFVDLLGFHELGHTLTINFGIDERSHWLAEFLAS